MVFQNYILLMYYQLVFHKITFIIHFLYSPLAGIMIWLLLTEIYESTQEFHLGVSCFYSRIIVSHILCTLKHFLGKKMFSHIHYNFNILYRYILRQWQVLVKDYFHDLLHLHFWENDRLWCFEHFPDILPISVL